MYSLTKLVSMTTQELEALARHLYNHCPHSPKRLHDEWEKDLRNIHEELNKRYT